MQFPTSKLSGTEGQPPIIDSIRFPKDPEGGVLEAHEVVFHFTSDSFAASTAMHVSCNFHPRRTDGSDVPSRDELCGNLRRQMDSVDHQNLYTRLDKNLSFTRFLETTYRRYLRVPPRAHRLFLGST